MDERFEKIKAEIKDMERGNLKKYGMMPVDYQIILVITRYLKEDGKALTFQEKMVEFFERHGFKTSAYMDGVNWLITV